MKLGDPQEVGKLMRERRKKLGYTQQEMAAAVGVSPITIMRIELGRVGYVHEKTAKALEVPTRITNRLVSVPTGVMADGSLQPLTNVGALPREMQAVLESGDSEALRAPKPAKEASRPVKRMYVKAQPKRSLRKRLFLWLAGE